MHRHARRLGIVLLLGAASAADAAGQADPFARAPLHVLDVTTRSRWVHDAVHPASVPFQTRGEALRIRRRGRGRGYEGWYHLDDGPLRGRLFVDARNRPSSIWAAPAERGYAVDRASPDGRMVRWEALRTQLPLPGPRLLDLAVPLPAGPLDLGAAWSDTTVIEAAGEAGASESVETRRHFQVVGDSLIDGRSLPRVRVEGEMVYRSSESVEDPGRDRPLLVERQGTGRIAGWIVVDTVLGLRAAGADTVRLQGLATLVLQDGRRYSTPARYERTRRWILRDSAAWEAARERRMTEARRTVGGMLIPPAPPPAPVAARALDSLWAAWEATVDPDEARGLADALHRAVGGPRDVLEARLRERRIARGDTSAMLAFIAGAGRWNATLDADAYALYHPFLDDPGRAWRFGITPARSYPTLLRVFEGAAPLVEPDTSAWRCPPADCEVILSRMEGAREARLREVAAVGRFLRDPAWHWERILALRDSGSTLVDGAIRLGRGAGAETGQGSVPAVPDPGASWRDWLAWMGGDLGRPRSSATPVYTARTGRDPMDDLERRWPDLREDSARLVFAVLLRDARRLPPPTVGDVHADLVSGSAARAAVARRELPRLRRSAEARTLQGAEAAAFLGPVLDSLLVAGLPPWPTLGDVWFPSALGQGFHGVREVPVHVLDRALPPGLLDDRAVILVDSASWTRRDRREGAVLVELGPAVQVGPLVHLDWSWSAWFPRAPDEVPEGYAGGESLWLARVGEGWVVVDSAGWIT